MPKGEMTEYRREVLVNRREAGRLRAEREDWLRVGEDRYMLVTVPNRLRGVRINEDGEAV